MDKKTRDNSAMMNGLYWWGVPTLFRCPHQPETDGCDIALVGVPHSTGNGTTQRDQHLGCLLYTSPSPRDLSTSRMPSSA